MRPRVLIVSQQTKLRAVVAGLLVPMGYFVELASNEETAREQVKKHKFKAVIIAPASLADPSIRFLQEIKSTVNDLIVLIDDKVADKQLKSFLPEALSCFSRPLDAKKILSFLGSHAVPDTVQQDARDIVKFAGCSLNIGGRSLLGPDGSEVPLTYREFSLLVAFVKNPGRVLSRTDLRDKVDHRSVGLYDRSVDMLVARVRRKIKTHATKMQIITTVPGAGYKFVAEVVQDNADP